MVYQILENGAWKNTTKAKYDAQLLIDASTVQILQPAVNNTAVTVKTVFSRSYNSDRTGFSYLMELSDGVRGLFSSLEEFSVSQLEGKEVFYEGGDLKTARTILGNTENVPVFWNLSLSDNSDLLDYQKSKDAILAKKDKDSFSEELAILGAGLASFTNSSGNVQVAVSFAELADMRAKMVKDRTEAEKARKARYA